MYIWAPLEFEHGLVSHILLETRQDLVFVLCIRIFVVAIIKSKAKDNHCRKKWKCRKQTETGMRRTIALRLTLRTDTSAHVWAHSPCILLTPFPS